MVKMYCDCPFLHLINNFKISIVTISYNYFFFNPDSSVVFK